MATHGNFCWYELSTTHIGAAKEFYSKVVGFSGRDMQMGGREYAMWVKPSSKSVVGGVSLLQESATAMGTPPNWMTYVYAEDIVATVEKAEGLGANVFVPPSDIPGIGQFAILADPQGAAFGLFTGEAMGQEGIDESLGGVAWHELSTSDVSGALAFYSALFGWAETEKIDLGPMGTYHMFGSGKKAQGGMMTATADMPAPAWLPYFSVADRDAAAAATEAAGGSTFIESDVPGGGKILMGTDPQGAAFAVWSKG